MTCAVSGGADSLALLVLASAAGCRVHAIHVDHGWRATGAEEAAIVADACSRFGATFTATSVSVPPGPNREARARAARYAALPTDVLTGHTADDQAETVLINLLRGAGLDGLSGMRARRLDIGHVGTTAGPGRPLLALRRHETAALCREVGLVPIHDPSNDDLSILRNRIRHDVMPLLEDAAQRDLVPVIARQAALVAEDADLLTTLARAIDPTDALALAAAPEPLARRAVREWLRPTGGGHPPDAGAVERVLEVARGRTVACELTGGWRVSRHRQRLELTPIAPSDSVSGTTNSR